MKLPEQGSQSAQRLAKGNKRLPIQTIVLRTLYAAGTLGTALVAPKMLKLFPLIDSGKRGRKELYARIDQALYRLHKRGLITFSKSSSRRPHAQLTKEGKEEITKIVLGQYRISEKVKWDGKWRMVIFDIREKRRRVRQRLRTLIRSAGMVRLQDSVWVYPYPCDEFVALLRAHLSSGTGELLSFTTDAIESDRHLREHFHLS